MANLKNITDVPVVESAEGLNLIVNDNGAAKQIAASAVGAQADFNVTDESHPAYIKNKPEVVQADWAETDETSAAYIKNKPAEWDAVIDLGDVEDLSAIHTPVSINGSNYEGIKEIIRNGELPRILIKMNYYYGEVYLIRIAPYVTYTDMNGTYLRFGINLPGSIFDRVLWNDDGTFYFN